MDIINRKLMRSIFWTQKEHSLLCVAFLIMKKTEEKQTQRKKKGGSACARSIFSLRSHLSAHVRSFGRRFVQKWSRFRCHPSIFQFSFFICHFLLESRCLCD